MPASPEPGPFRWTFQPDRHLTALFDPLNAANLDGHVLPLRKGCGGVAFCLCWILLPIGAGQPMQSAAISCPHSGGCMHLSSSFSRHQAPADSAQRRQNLRLWVKACFRHTPVSQPACCNPAQGLKALTALGASRWKRPPSPVRFGVISALGALVLTGCGTPILRANFDTNSLGTHPGPELPGEPVGDSFYLSAPTSGSAVVVAAPEGLSGRSLRYRHSAPMAYSRFLGFGGQRGVCFFAAVLGRLECHPPADAQCAAGCVDWRRPFRHHGEDSVLEQPGAGSHRCQWNQLCAHRTVHQWAGAHGGDEG